MPVLKDTVDSQAGETQLEILIQGQGEVFALLAAGSPLPEVLSAIALWAEAQIPGALASLLLTDTNGSHLLHGAAPNLPADYSNSINGLEIKAGNGSCGTAAATKKTVIAEDIYEDSYWTLYRPLAANASLRSCWSTPLVNRYSKVLGTFALYFKVPSRPREEQLSMLRLLCQTASVAIEFKQAEEERKLRLLTESELSEKIRAERKHFYTLLMHAPAMIAVLRGPDHVFELTNSLYNQAVGAGRNLLGQSVAEALPEVVEQGFIDILNNVYNKQEPFFGNEVPLMLDRQGNGQMEERFFNFVYQPIINDSGDSEGIFVHAVDITIQVDARKRAESSEERFRSFVINAPMPIGIFVGREMRIQTANEAILQAWGKDASVVGMTFREALPELEGQPFYQLLDDVYTTGVPYIATEDRVDLVRYGKLEITYYNFTYKALRDEKGEIFGVMNTAAEVTDLVRAKQQLAQTQAELSNAIELAELGTWSIDLNRSMLTYSPRVAQWFNLPAHEAPLDEVLGRVHEDDRTKVSNLIQQAIA
ncbi:MAG: PAS domain S-box protein, partial [Sphingobacteriales bacterium]